jgi:hypothetical protein
MVPVCRCVGWTLVWVCVVCGGWCWKAKDYGSAVCVNGAPSGVSCCCVGACCTCRDRAALLALLAHVQPAVMFPFHTLPSLVVPGSASHLTLPGFDSRLGLAVRLLRVFVQVGKMVFATPTLTYHVDTITRAFVNAANTEDHFVSLGRTLPAIADGATSIGGMGTCG